jgi:type VI secretion system protein ImpA
VRDVERAFAHPRPSDALAPESVARQLEDLRTQQPDMMAGFDRALVSLASIDGWCKEHLGVYQPDLSALHRLLRRVAGDRVRVAATPAVPDFEEVPPVNVEPAATPSGDAPAAHGDIGQPTVAETGVARAHVAVRGREGALGCIREARLWYEQHEPSSPISMLLRRAEQLVGKRYPEVVNAIPAELLAQWEGE